MGKIPDFKTCKINDVTDFAAQTTSDLIEKHIEEMTPEQISAVIIQINDANDQDWQPKTQSAILGLTSRPKLEAAGKILSLPQIFDLMDKILQIEDKHHWKLSPLLVGMPHETFQRLLALASEKQLHILKHESVTEPIQHHITLFAHEMNKQMGDLGEKFKSLEQEIETLDIENFGHDDINQMMDALHDLSHDFNSLLALSNKILSLAWNSNRIDLIESLNTIKDGAQKYQTNGIGTHKTKDLPGTGLYGKLNDKLFGVYGNLNDPNDIEALRDEEPVIEAIVKFSVWYLKDYWNMGLLPGIKNQEDLDIDMENHNEAERAEYREKLFALAKETLEQMGLSTVKDLKDAYIYSKKTLQEYVDHRKLRDRI